VRKLDRQAARDKQKEVENRRQSVFHDLVEGWNFFFVLPPWSDECVLWKEVQQHGFGLVCPKMASKDGAKKPCLICDEIKKRQRKGDSEFGDEYRLKSRAFFNAIRKADVKAKSADSVKVLGLSPTVFSEILDYIADDDVDISDPTAAVVVGIKRVGKGLRTRYRKIRFGDPVDISRYLTDDVMEGMYDLDALRAAQPATLADMRKALRKAKGVDEDLDDDDFEGDDDDLADDDPEAGEAGDEEDDLFDEQPSDDEDGDLDDDDGEADPEDDPEEGEEDPEDPDDDLDDADLFDDESEEEEPEPPKRPRKKTAKKKAKTRRRTR
jgi:hypothetical protein